RAARATADAGPRLRIHRDGAGRRRRPADAVSVLRWVLPSLPPGLRWAGADLAARRSRGHTGRAALRDTPCGLPGVRSHDGVGALGRPRLVVQPDRLACNPKSAGPLGRHPRPGPKMASALPSSRRTVRGRVTANKMEVVTSGSNHQAVGMAVSVCTTPAAPSPIPVPYPTMAPPKHRRYLNGPGRPPISVFGFVSAALRCSSTHVRSAPVLAKASPKPELDGRRLRLRYRGWPPKSPQRKVKDAPMRTKVNGKEVLTVGAVINGCIGNEPGTLKEVVSLNNSGPCFPLMGDRKSTRLNSS